MGIEQLEQRKREIVERFGPWTANNIHLGDGVYTIGRGVHYCAGSLRRFTQIISDTACKPLNNLRVLDLACLEGLYAIELALHGAEVVAIEGREANIEKARFAKDVLSLENLELVQDDVRNLSKEKYGHFDAVLCAGILYHLDIPDVFTFLERIAEVCKGVVIIDTHVSMTIEKCYIYNGKRYWGSKYVEHSTKASVNDKDKALWASLDNISSFWFTRSSLLNLLSHVGFTSVYECNNPSIFSTGFGRITLVAMKGRRETLFTMPMVETAPDWPEMPTYLGIMIKLGRLLPERIRKIAKMAFR